MQVKLITKILQNLHNKWYVYAVIVSYTRHAHSFASMRWGQLPDVGSWCANIWTIYGTMYSGSNNATTLPESTRQLHL